MGAVDINPQQEDMVYDMDTGELRPKKKDLEGIQEGEGDEDEAE